MNLPYFLAALVGGAALATQVALNGKLRSHVGDPLVATLVSFSVGGCAVLAIVLAARYPWPDRERMAAMPWWAWLGGTLGVLYIWATVVAAPRIGLGATFGLVVCGQIATALVVDHFGLLHAPVQPVNVWKVLGAGLVVAGVAVLAAAK